MTTSPGTIELVNVSKSFRHFRTRTVKEALVQFMRREPARERRQVLTSISLTIEPGERVGIVGRNGAGKSTLFRILSGILIPDSGEVLVAGRLAPLIEVTAGFVPDMTGDENLRLNAAILGVSRAEVEARYDRIVSFAGLQDFMGTPMRYYSSGMQTRLGFSVVAHVDADIVLVDEALSVGDLEFQKASLARMDQIASGGATVVFVSHELESIQRFCSRVLWLDGGRIRMDGPPSDVVAALRADAAPM